MRPYSGRLFGSHLPADGYSWSAKSFYTLPGCVFVVKILKRHFGSAYFQPVISQEAAITDVGTLWKEFADAFRRRFKSNTPPLTEDYATRIYKKLSLLG